MKYKILEILPGQIRVEYENGSWALVPVGPNQSPEEIDNSVSKYDPDFLPKPEELINTNILIGEERESKIINNEQLFENSLNNTNVNPQQNTINIENIPKQDPQFTPSVKLPVLTFGQAHSIDAVVIGNYFSERGDNRIKEAIEKNIEDFIIYSNFSVEKMVNDLKDDSSEIFMRALTELEQEGESNGNE